MEDQEFRCFLDLLMCSDPWPIDDVIGPQDVNSQKVLDDLADRLSRERGFADWIAAYHQFEVV